MATTHGTQTGIKVDAKRAIAKVQKVASLLEVGALLEGIGMRHLYWIGQNLDSAGSTAGGVPWQQMAPRTITQRPLRQSGRHFSSPYQTLLRQSMSVEVREAQAQVEVGTNARYAVYHHFGAKKGGWVLPSRKLVPEPPTAKLLAQDFMNAVVRQLKSAGSV